MIINEKINLLEASLDEKIKLQSFSNTIRGISDMYYNLWEFTISKKELDRNNDATELAKYDNVIGSVSTEFAKKSYEIGGLTRDEYYQTIMVKVLEVARKKGWDKLTFPLVKKIAHDAAVDKYRKDLSHYRKEISIQQQEQAESEGKVKHSDLLKSKIGLQSDVDMDITMRDFIKSLSDSKERAYAVIKFWMADLISESDAKKFGVELPKRRSNGKLPDGDISVAMGLSPRSGTFAKVKKSVESKLSKFLFDINN